MNIFVGLQFSMPFSNQKWRGNVFKFKNDLINNLGMVSVESEKDEVITDLIPGPPIEYEKRQRYISKYNEPIKEEIKKEKYAHRTFGLPQVPLKLPSQYLKKRSRKEYCKTDVKHVHIRDPEYQRKLPSWVPVKMEIKEKCGELPVDPVKLGRINFKKQNIIDVKKSQPFISKERYVDTRYGDTHDLKSSGLYPIYIHRKGFGKVPKSVKKIRCEVVDKELREDKPSDHCIDEPKYHCISEEERKELLDGMKRRWDEMMKQFQSLPFIIDTPPKVQRKAKLEHELQQLEKDITILERHSYICVNNDDENE
ncbi:PREDICTED: enkurin isoform X2 [Polistes canadensis]|uniref:enkurin isoform X2 n=1 Tax=Polistes canadensis TaxID=91411 RepID=UPI000718ED77|nr:PREDICTED: enkurin isoform X2 [Polistes canadensis]